MALTVACAHCSGLGAACVSFGTGRSAHVFVHSPLVPVVGALCSAQSHAIPAASRFFILAPSGPCERQLRCTERPLLASQPHTPAPDRAPPLQQARPPRFPTSSPNGTHVRAQSRARRAPARASALERQSLCLVCESVIRLANKTSVSTEINCLRILHAIALVLVCESRVDRGQRGFSALAHLRWRWQGWSLFAGNFD